MLKLVPAELKDTGLITLIDYDSYRQENEVSLTNSEGEPISFEDYIDLVLSDKVGRYMIGSNITGYGKYALTSPINDKYVGYNFTDIDAEIQFGAPPANGVAAIGSFDPEATRDALTNQDEWPSSIKEAYTTEEYQGITIHSWGDGFKIDLRTVLTPPHVDELGRARPLAISEKYLFFAARVPTVKSMIDSSQGKTESLADVPEFASVAKGLSDLNAYTAIVGDESLANGDPEHVALYQGPRLKKFELFGSGLGRDEKGIYVALVLIHDTHTDASANIPLLKQRIAEGTSIYTNQSWSDMITDTQIDAEGNVLLAKLYTESSGLWVQWAYAQDTLLLHEQE